MLCLVQITYVGAMGGKGGKQQQKKKGPKTSHIHTHDDERFCAQLLSCGTCVINKIKFDGNCLFHSISDQLNHNSTMVHALIWEQVCNYLSCNEEEFAMFVLLNDNEGKDVADFGMYIDKLSEDGEWDGTWRWWLLANALGGT